MAVQDPPATTPVLQDNDALFTNIWLTWLRTLARAAGTTSSGGSDIIEVQVFS